MYCINKVNFQNFATENFSFSINRVTFELLLRITIVKPPYFKGA